VNFSVLGNILRDNSIIFKLCAKLKRYKVHYIILKQCIPFMKRNVRSFPESSDIRFSVKSAYDGMKVILIFSVSGRLPFKTISSLHSFLIYFQPLKVKRTSAIFPRACARFESRPAY
jgi:hypothetical protein